MVVDALLDGDALEKGFPAGEDNVATPVAATPVAASAVVFDVVIVVALAAAAAAVPVAVVVAAVVAAAVASPLGVVEVQVAPHRALCPGC